MAFDIRGEVAQLRDAIADGEGPSGVFQTEGISRGECSRRTILSKLSSFDRRENRAIPT
jgi:DNA-directed RNA polymerase subunit N (RpoN/RPB10)